MDNPYLEVISYVERIHRQFLEVVKLELEGFGSPLNLHFPGYVHQAESG